MIRLFVSLKTMSFKPLSPCSSLTLLIDFGVFGQGQNWETIFGPDLAFFLFAFKANLLLALVAECQNAWPMINFLCFYVFVVVKEGSFLGKRGVLEEGLF